MQVYAVVTNSQVTSFNNINAFEKKIPLGNNLISYLGLYTGSIENYEIWLPISKNILIDSGAFSFQTQNKQTKNIEIKDFFNNYIKWIKKNDDDIIKGFFEFDIDEVIGYENVLKCREKLFEVTDKIIPVWHHTLGINEFKKMCDDYDYISISCVGDKDIPEKQLPYFVKHAHKKNTKIHGLGMTRKRVLDKVPFDTVDSSSWFKGQRYGRYNGKRINSEWLRKTNNYSSVTFLEYLDNIKFQQHYYNKWRFYHND